MSLSELTDKYYYALISVLIKIQKITGTSLFVYNQRGLSLTKEERISIEQ